MGSRVLQTWECDRCSTTDEGPDNYWPNDWTTVRLGLPNITSAPVILCNNCTDGLRAWWELPRQELALAVAQHGGKEADDD